MARSSAELRGRSGFAVHPDRHRCGVGDIEYGLSQHQCRVCGRLWLISHGRWPRISTVPITKVPPPR